MIKILDSFKRVFLDKPYLEHIIFLVLAFFAGLFFKERLLADSSYYLFRLVNEERFIIEHSRHILFFSQIFAFIALKLQLSLKAILLFYSLGHILFYYIIFLIGRYHYHAKESGWMLILMQILGIMSGFFVPMFEMYYSAALLLLFYFILFYSENRFKLIPLLLLTYFIICGHFYAILLLGLVLLFHFSEYKLKYWKTYIPIGFLVVIYMIIKQQIATPYEIGKSKAFIHNLQNATYNLDYIKSLLVFLANYYFEMLLLFVLTIVFMSIRKKYFEVFIFSASFLVLLAMVNVSNYGFDQSRYQEQVYFPLSFLVGFGFVKYVFTDSKRMQKSFFIIILLGISVFRFSAIYEDGMKFKSRTHEMNSYIQEAQESDACKFLVDDEKLVNHANWSWPIESMLFSAMDSELKTVSIATLKDYNYGKNKEELKPDNYMFRRYEIIKISGLNSNYFRLCEGNYEKLPQLQVQ